VLQRLRQQPGTGGLAVGAGDAGHRQAGRRRIEEAVGDEAELRAQIRHRAHHDRRIERWARVTPGAGSHRIARAPAATASAREVQAVVRAAAAGQEGRARRHAAAVLRDVRDFQALGHVDQAAEQRP
jgi:hypothetical protein